MVVQVHGWHPRTRFDGVRISNPAPEVLRCVWNDTGGNRVAAHEMRQIRTESPVRGRACDRVAVYAGRHLEDAPAAGDCVIDLCGPALPGDPAIECGARVDVHAKQHLGVLRATILRTLAQV